MTAVAAYRVPAFRRYAAGQAVSVLGDQVWYVALSWAAVQVAGASAAGAVLAVSSVPRLVFMLFGGVLVDRRGPRGAIASLVRRSAALTALATVPFALVCTVFAAPIVQLVFGPAFAPAAPVLRLLAWTIPISVLGGHFRHTLISLKQTRVDAAAVAAGALATVSLNVALTDRLGLAGGAMAMVAGEAVLTLTAIALVVRRVDLR